MKVEINGGDFLPRTIEEEAVFELHFWLQILGDHARFIHDSLSPTEIEKLRQPVTLLHNLTTCLTIQDSL